MKGGGHPSVDARPFFVRLVALTGGPEGIPLPRQAISSRSTRKHLKMADEFETGLGIFGEIYGDKAAEQCRAYVESGSFGSEQAGFAMSWAFGTVWPREGLERKMRSCAVLGMMIALRQFDEIAYHTKMGLENGLTRDEIEEILLTSVPYCGLPASNIAKEAMRKAFAEIDGE